MTCQPLPVDVFSIDVVHGWGMLSLGDIDRLERELRAAVVALNKKKLAGVTLVEAIDTVSLWPAPFDELTPLVPKQSLDGLLSRAPLFVCAAAAEIGFRFEGVGTEYWAKLSDAFGLPITMAQRALPRSHTHKRAELLGPGRSRPS